MHSKLRNSHPRPAESRAAAIYLGGLGPTGDSDKPGKPFVQTLAEIAAVLNMPPELVWDFVSRPWRWARPPEPPLEKLKRGEVEAVLDAAPGYLCNMG